jgi:hypothetical protein
MWKSGREDRAVDGPHAGFHNKDRWTASLGRLTQWSCSLPRKLPVGFRPARNDAKRDGYCAPELNDRRSSVILLGHVFSPPSIATRNRWFVSPAPGCW